jgi:threonine dehydrogenase-like Zn-dependent dehydrogenase
MLSYRDSFHAVIDGVSRDDTLLSGIELGVKGGNILVYGVPKSDLTPIPLFNLFRKDMRLITCRLYQRSFKKAIELLSEGRIHVNPMITHRVNLEDFPGLVSKIAQGKEKAIKIIVNVED